MDSCLHPFSLILIHQSTCLYNTGTERSTRTSRITWRIWS